MEHTRSHSGARLPGLDLLRIAAAGSVLFFHLGFWSWSSPTAQSILQGAASFPTLAPFAWWGFVGVEIFFALSGFVIAYSAGRGSSSEFLRRRLLRLYPTAIICATVTFAVVLAVDWRPPGEDLTARFLKSVSLWPAGPWIDGSYWTLGIEMSFYLLVAVTIAAGLRDRIEAIIVVVGSLSSFSWLLLYASAATGYNPPFVPTGRIAELLLVSHGMIFAVGVLVWSGTFKGWTPARSLLCLAFTVAGTMPIITEAVSRSETAGIDPGLATPILAWWGSVCLMVAAATFNSSLRAAPAWILRIISTAALATYPLYLLHQTIGIALIRQFVLLGFSNYAALAAAAMSVMMLALLVTLAAEPMLRTAIGSLASPGRRASTHPAQ